jgi:hypothetical protein
MDHRGRDGPSFHRWDPPDIAFLALIGDISGHDMQRLIEVTLLSVAGRSYVLGLIDFTRVGTISPEARMIARTSASHFPMRGTAIFGGGFHHRVLALLVNKAASLLKKDHQPIAFFATEEEARAWLDERREVVLAKERTAGRVP